MAKLREEQIIMFIALFGIMEFYKTLRDCATEFAKVLKPKDE